MQELVETIEDIKKLPTVLPLVVYPNPVLNEVSKPVLNGIRDNKTLQELLDAMVFTMEAYDAVGLSAVQVGIPMAVFVARTDSGVIKVVNPSVVYTSETKTYDQEGCLSVPYLYTRISRPEKATLEYFDELGEKQEYEAEGYFARIVLHEMEHLTGKTFFDSMDTFQRARELRNYKHIQRKMK